jgi:hypothetical protein
LLNSSWQFLKHLKWLLIFFVTSHLELPIYCLWKKKHNANKPWSYFLRYFMFPFFMLLWPNKYLCWTWNSNFLWKKKCCNVRMLALNFSFDIIISNRYFILCLHCIIYQNRMCGIRWFHYWVADKNYNAMVNKYLWNSILYFVAILNFC